MSRNDDDNDDESYEHLLVESTYKFEILELDKTANLTDKVPDQTKPQDIIPTLVKLLFSLPSFSKMACMLLLSVHLIVYYENLGANLLYISFFVALARAVEILLKPVIAHYSDIARFRLGRRKPFMLLGMPFYAIFFVLIFNPPAKLTPIQTSLFFGFFYVLFFIADTVCNVPYYALAPELSSDSREREKLFILYYIFQYLGVLFASGGPVIYSNFFNFCDCSYCNLAKEADKKVCLDHCKVTCYFNTNQMGLIYISIIISIFFALTFLLLCVTVIEKKQSSRMDEKSYLVPKFFRIFSNVPFYRLLIPWIIDVTITTIFATMLPFFLSVIINPQKYCKKNNIDLKSMFCYSNTWLGIVISIFIIFCILSMLLWHVIVSKIGKKKSWILYSLISIVTFSVLLFCGEGSIGLVIVASILISFPAGGAYLNDVFIADIIDYDEFITGQRNEGLYTLFTSFIPKIVSIFAQSVPLAAMGIIGFVSSNKGISKNQPEGIIEFIRFYFIGIPILLAFVSFCLKLKYPIDNEDKMQIIKDSVICQKQKIADLRMRLDFYKIRDPIMENYSYQIFSKTPEHDSTKVVVEHFQDFNYFSMLYRGQNEEIRKKMIQIIVVCFLSLILFGGILALTFNFLQIKSLSFIPIISLLILAITIVILVLNWIRLTIINKVISGDLKIDREFLRLLIISFHWAKQDKSEISKECEKLSKFFSKNN